MSEIRGEVSGSATGSGRYLNTERPYTEGERGGPDEKGAKVED